MSRLRQIHLWITESDYLLLREQAVERRETLSAWLRRLIRAHRLRGQEAGPRHVAGATAPPASEACIDGPVSGVGGGPQSSTELAGPNSEVTSATRNDRQG
jgi:hypothetical protein